MFAQIIVRKTKNKNFLNNYLGHDPSRHLSRNTPFVDVNNCKKYKKPEKKTLNVNKFTTD